MALRKRIMRGCITTVLVSFLLAPQVVWGQQTADKPEGTEIVFDFVIARPVGVLSLVLGTSIFLVSYPIAVLTGSGKNTADALVAEPYKFTFERELGTY
jgi:hypothetical protein